MTTPIPPADFIILRDGYLRRVGTPEQEPSPVLVRWRLVQVRHADGSVQRHLYGNVDGEGRITTALTAIDLQTLLVTTSSGRVYAIHGEPRSDYDASSLSLYRAWVKFGKRTELKDLTRSLLRLRRMQGKKRVPSPVAVDVAAKMFVKRAVRRKNTESGDANDA